MRIIHAYNTNGYFSSIHHPHHPNAVTDFKDYMTCDSWPACVLLVIIVCWLVLIILIISCRAGPQVEFLLCRRSHHCWYWILGISFSESSMTTILLSSRLLGLQLDLAESYIFRFEVKWVDPPCCA